MAPAAGDEVEAQSLDEGQESDLKPVFEAVLRLILGDYEGDDGPGQASRDGMEVGMRKLFDNPYEKELAALSCTPAEMTMDDARRVFFVPQLGDMRCYVEALGRSTPESTHRRERVMKFKVLSVFYALHRRDTALMDRFVHYGGLVALASLLSETHNVIQSQAVELLLEFLSPLMQLLPANSARVAHLHHMAYECLCSGAFWENMAKIVAEPHEVFPKSHNNCVRIMAGAIGWLRPQEEGVLPQAGAMPVGLDNAKMSLRSFSECDTLQKLPDIKATGEDLLQELEGSVVIRADPLRGKALIEARQDIFAPSAEEAESQAHAWQALRRLGNSAFGAGLMWPAEATYRLALASGGDMVPARDASLLQSNRALALLKAGHPLDAAAAAAAALALDENNSKAAFRRAKALLQAAPSTSERAAAKAALEAAQRAAQLEPKDPQVAELLKRAQEWEERLAQTCDEEEPPAVAGTDPLSLDCMD